MRNIDALFEALGRSSFRSRFRLNEKDGAYLCEKGTEVIRQHAFDFVRQRLGPSEPQNDGRQTPMRRHPVFTAQHATGTCCRKCLEKWHHISRGRELTSPQIAYIVDVISHWLKKQTVQESAGPDHIDHQVESEQTIC